MRHLLHYPVLVDMHIQSVFVSAQFIHGQQDRIVVYLSGTWSIVIIESSPSTLWFFGSSDFVKLVSFVEPDSVIFLPASFCIHDSVALFPSAELIPGTTRGILAILIVR